MKLTQEQKDMLDGKYGKGTAYAMKIQVAIGESFDAERMVPITRAHVALSNQEADLWFCEKLLSEGAKCRVTPTVNPGFCLDFLKRDMVAPEYADLMQRTHNAYKAIGAQLTYNCTPYIDTNVPNFKEVIAFSESSATPYANAVWGARTNREGANSALCAAITGYVPEYGLLLDENRKGDILVEVQADVKTAYDYHIIGMLGKKIGEGIPVFAGFPKETITKEALRNLGAQLNTSGAYGMYHILGVTPEAPDLETAFGGKEPKRKVVLTNEDKEAILKEISEEGNRKIDFAMFGCPHFTLEEVKYIASKVEGKTLKKEMWILVSSHVKEMAVRMGLDEIISNAGGFIVPDTCPDQPCWRHLEGKIGITESPKCAYYPQRRGIHFVIRDLDTCIEAALTGEVK